MSLPFQNSSELVALTKINNIIQSVNQECSFTCVQNQSNTQIFIAPGASTGPINFTQECTISNAICAMKNLVHSTVKEIIETLPTRTQISSLPITGYSSEILHTDTKIEETIRNNILQLISSTCTFETEQTLNDTFVYIGSNATTGIISFAQKSNLNNVTCATDVIAKVLSYNEETKKTSTNSQRDYYNIIIYLFMFVGVLTVLCLIFYRMYRN